jgi:hypothetical protein
VTPRRRLELALLSASLTSGALLGGCHVHRQNSDHCFYAEGDQTCATLDPAHPFCAGPGCGDITPGCVAELPPDACYSPCGHAALLSDDASCIEPSDESTDAGTETSSSSGPPDVSTDECQQNADCPELEPYCSFGTCVTCDATPDPAAACFALTGGASTICLDGECVICTAQDSSACTDATPICDPATHTCVPCTSHEQCPGQAACDLVLGECLPADQVWHIDGDGGQDFLTIAEALAALGNGSGTLFIHALDNNAGYVEGISFSGDRALALFGAAGEQPLLYQTPVSLEVLESARVYARGVTLRGQDALLITASHVELDNVILAPQLRSTLRAEDATLRVRNCMLRSTTDVNYPALELAGTVDLDLRYSSLLAFGEHAAISCQGAALVPGSRVRNSLLVNLGTAHAVQCAAPSYEHNALEDATGFVDNTSVGDAVFQWFVNSGFGDLHLSNIAPISIAAAASWSEGDPLFDVDGDPRPTLDGSPDFAGADRIP